MAPTWPPRQTQDGPFEPESASKGSEDASSPFSLFLLFLFFLFFPHVFPEGFPNRLGERAWSDSLAKLCPNCRPHKRSHKGRAAWRSSSPTLGHTVVSKKAGGPTIRHLSTSKGRGGRSHLSPHLRTPPPRVPRKLSKLVRGTLCPSALRRFGQSCRRSFELACTNQMAC